MSHCVCSHAENQHIRGVTGPWCQVPTCRCIGYLPEELSPARCPNCAAQAQEIAALRERAERAEAACFQAQEAAKNEMRKAIAAEATVERLRGALREIESCFVDDADTDILDVVLRALAGEELTNG